METIKKHRVLILLLTAIALGAFLRLYNFHDLVRFNDDQARDAQIVNSMIEQKEFPLLGPKAGGTKFNLGPAFYYLEYFSALIFGNTPAGIAAITVLLAIASIPLLFLFLRFYFSKNISLFITFIYSISFFAIKYSKFSWNPNVIPFFLLIFFIALYETSLGEKNADCKKRWHILLGLSIGIGAQLHTLLLALLPLLVILELARAFFAKNRNKAKGLLAALAVGLVFNLPLVIHDLKNSGENIGSFFQGTDKKTGNDFSAGKNLLKSFQFFVNGNIYVLSGYEPQKDWLDSKNYFSSENRREILASVAGSVFLLAGFFLLIFRYRKEKEKDRKKFLEIILFSFIASFLIFWPLAGDLKARFFMVCFLYPFVFLALWLSFISRKIANKNLSCLLFIATAIILAYTNFSIYKKAYDFNNYSHKGDVYGGFSLKEAEQISSFVIESASSKNLQNRKFYLLPFKFNKSVAFLNKKAGLKTSMLNNSAAAKTSPEAVLVYLGKSKNKKSVIGKKSKDFDFINSHSVGRFEVFLFQNKKIEEIKIGFITDVHARRIKAEKGDLNVSSRTGLENFIARMNNNFHPDFAVQGGDLIEGTKRRGQASIDDFQLAKKYLEKLNVPIYHVNGNHDMRGFSKNEWIKLTNNNKNYYFFNHKNTRFIVLDGNENESVAQKELNGDDPYGYVMTNGQFEWLENVLAETKEKRKIIFIHYPPIIKGGTRNMNPDQAQKLREIFSRHKVTAVFSGHAEILDFTELDSVRYFTIPGVNNSEDKKVRWLDSFAEIYVGNEARVRLYYKRDRSESYQTIEIPSVEYDKLEK